MKKKRIQPTPYGDFLIIWCLIENKPRVRHVLLPEPDKTAPERAAELYPEARSASCRLIDEIASAIHAMLSGEPVTFDPEVVNWGLCTAFEQAVLRAEHAIPRGRVSTYQLIAAHLGNKNSARAAGSALAKNPFPLIIPCHRAIRSDRRPGGFRGGAEMKRALLEAEGLAFDTKGRAIVDAFYYATG